MEGVNQVARTVNRARCVWREVVHRDLGIDGHIEYVRPDGFAPGRLIAAQVKSGESRFANATTTHVPFYPEKKHRDYWSEYPLPVILILHNPVSGESIWTDARERLRVRGDEAAVLVPRNSVFDTDGVVQALASSGPLPAARLDPSVLLSEMATTDPTAQGLCFLYLFAQGMTDVGNSLYFGMDVVSEVLDVMSADWDPPAFAIGRSEYEFIDRYIAFLVRNDLARVDFGSWRQTNLERGMVGTFVAPLTARGRALRDTIVDRDERLGPSNEDSFHQPYSRAIQERFVQMLYNRSGIDEVAARHRRIETLRSSLF